MVTVTTKPDAPTNHDVGRDILAGTVGGLVGGMVFGMLMQMMGMIPTIAALVGHSSLLSGWSVHLLISMALGAGFGLVLGRQVTTWLRGILLGAAYGMVWWVLGALVLLPARLGMPLLRIDSMAWQSLMGHMIYGVILGAVSFAILRRGAASA